MPKYNALKNRFKPICGTCGKGVNPNNVQMRTKQRQEDIRCRSCAVKEKNAVFVDEDEIRRLYIEEELSCTDIAKMDVAIDKRSGRHISNVCIKRIVGKENLRSISEVQKLSAKRNPKKNKLGLPLDKVKEMYVDKELPTGYIANYFRCDAQTIRNNLKYMGVELREITVSKQEIKIRELLDENNISFITNDRKTLSKYRELDILIPSHNLAIEVNGLYWHSQKDKNYHKNKTDECKEKGIQLLHFTDLQIENKFPIVESILKNKLELNAQKYYARKCFIDIVSKEDEKTFFEENHIQGYIPSKWCFGLYTKDEGKLVSVMSFGKARFNKNFSYEILRSASLLNVNVVGGVSRLIKHFINHHLTSGESLMTYAQLDTSDGFSYKKAGMQQFSYTEPDYHYESFRAFPCFVSRYQAMKHKLVKQYPELAHLSESQIMKHLGYMKIYGCGSAVFIIIKD